MVCCIPGPQHCPKAHAASPPVLLGVLGSEPASDRLLSLGHCSWSGPSCWPGRWGASHVSLVTQQAGRLLPMEQRRLPRPGKSRPGVQARGPKPGASSWAGEGGAPTEREGLEGHTVAKSPG